MREDLTRRWNLLAEAKGTVEETAPTAAEIAAQQRGYLSAVATLTAPRFPTTRR